MKESTQNPITTIGISLFRKEFAEKQNERVYWVREKERAAAFGDRSENAEYISAKEMIRNLDKRLRFLQNIIRTARVIDPKDISDRDVRFGKKVYFDDGSELLLVGSLELSLFKHGVSCFSPVGKALLGKRVGDTVKIGEKKLSISKIESIDEGDVV